MKVLITGTTGFIGSHLAEALHQKRYQLRCLVRKTSDLKWIKHLPIEYVYGTLFDSDVLKKAVEGVDYIYHVAGVNKAKRNSEYYEGNYTATKIFLEAILSSQQQLKRFVYISSQAAVGPSEKDKPVNEQTPFHPITAYGVSKMQAEQECLRLKEKIPITIVRPPAVYGPRDTDVFAFFAAMNMGLQAMIGFHKKYVSLVNVKDLVEGIILAGEHPNGVGQTYFIASERFYHWEEIGDRAARVMNKQALRVHVPEFVVYGLFATVQFFSFFSKKPLILSIDKAKDIVQDAWTCDITKAKMELGYREKFTLEEGIKQTVLWYREHGWLK
jgi:nucleoside-diphosphate-sugar epimerase